MAYATPCWNPASNLLTGPVSIPPTNPKSPVCNSTAAATPAANPASCSAKNIETVLSATNPFPFPSLGEASINTNLASLYFCCASYIAVSNLNPGHTINLKSAS